MKPVLIDRSLVGMNFFDTLSGNELTDKTATFMYVCSLLEAGASYVELDFKSLMRLPKPSGSENYIYRISAPEEFVVANALKFEYAVLPLEFVHILPRLELPLILEVDVGDATDALNVFKLLHMISEKIDFTRFQMLRIVGVFDSDTLPTLIATYRRRTIIPLDICPVNTHLSALDSAITAYRSGFDAITVCYGDGSVYASLEETLIMLGAMYRLIVTPNYLEGICKASMLSMLFTEAKNANLNALMKRYVNTPVPVTHIDAKLYIKRIAPYIRLQPDPNAHKITAKMVGTLGLDKEMADELVKILESCSFKIAD
jgi:hypothetical protein